MPLIVTVVLMFGILCLSCSPQKRNSRSAGKLIWYFRKASAVKVFSYTGRMLEPVHDSSSLVVRDLRIPKNAIRETVTLTKAQGDALLRLLNQNMCDIDGTGICYDPHHSIIFFDSDNRPANYIEFCFGCTNYQTPGDFEIDFCYEKAEALEVLLASFGITYFQNGEELP